MVNFSLDEYLKTNYSKKSKKKKPFSLSAYLEEKQKPAEATTTTNGTSASTTPSQPPSPHATFESILKQYESIEQGTSTQKKPVETYKQHMEQLSSIVPPNPMIPGLELAKVGLYPARYTGGVVGRIWETPQQVIRWAVAKGYQKWSSYKPYIPPDYNVGHAFGRWFFPGKYYRLDEKVMTGQDWDTWKGFGINLATAFATDPLMYQGIKPSKLALGKRALGGLSDMGELNVVEKHIAETVPNRLQFLKDAAESLKGTPEGDVVAQHLVNVTPDVEQAMKTPHIVDMARLARAEDEALKQVISVMPKGFKAVQEPLLRSALETARGNVDPRFMEIAELYPQLKNPQLAHGALMKFLSKAGDEVELVDRMKYIGASEAQLKAVEPILKFIRKSPEKIGEIFKDSVRMSEKMKSGDYSYVIGPGAGLGFYKLSWEGDPLAKIRPAMARSLGALEELTGNWNLGKMFQGMSKSGKRFQMPLDPLIVKPLYETDKATGELHVVGADIVGNIDMNLKRLKHAQRAALIKHYFRFQEDIHAQIFEPMINAGMNPRDVFEYTELGAEKFAGKYGMSHAANVEPYAGILRRKFDETAINQLGYKDFNLLKDYITRVALTNDKKQSAMDAFVKWRFRNTDDALKRNGMYGKLVARRFSNPSMRITSQQHLARARNVPGWLQNEIRLNRYLREIEDLKGNTEWVTKLDDDFAFAEKMANDYTSVEKGGKGLFPPELGPIAVNEGWQNEYGKDLDAFVKSDAGRRWGFPEGSTGDSFKVFSEDPEHVLSTYAKGYANTMATGEIFNENFIRDFGIDPSKYEAAEMLAKTGKNLDKETMQGIRTYERLGKALENTEGAREISTGGNIGEGRDKQEGRYSTELKTGKTADNKWRKSH
jgi:hypothetical protein